MKNIIQFSVSKGDKYYVASAIDLPIVTQAKTLDELSTNIDEAVSLHLEDEDVSDIDFSKNISILMLFEIPRIQKPDLCLH